MIRALAQIAPPASRWAVPAACGWGGRRRPGGGRGASGRAPGGRGCWRPGSRRPAVRSPAPGRRRPGARRSGLGDDGRAAAGQDAGPALDHRPARGQQGPAGMQAVERLRLRPDLRHDGQVLRREGRIEGLVGEVQLGFSLNAPSLRDRGSCPSLRRNMVRSAAYLGPVTRAPPAGQRADAGRRAVALGMQRS